MWHNSVNDNHSINNYNNQRFSDYWQFVKKIETQILILEYICKSCEFLPNHDKSNPQEQYILRILKIPLHCKGGFGIDFIKF